jgi:hypothetical protein
MVIEIAVGIVLAVIILNVLAVLAPIAFWGSLGIFALCLKYIQDYKRQLKIILGIAIGYLILALIAKNGGTR